MPYVIDSILLLSLWCLLNCSYDFLLSQMQLTCGFLFPPWSVFPEVCSLFLVQLEKKKKSTLPWLILPVLFICLFVFRFIYLLLRRKKTHICMSTYEKGWREKEEFQANSTLRAEPEMGFHPWDHDLRGNQELHA